MACRFELRVPGDGAELFDRVRRDIEAHGGSVTGTYPAVVVTLPTPLGPVQGTGRAVAPDRIAIEITRKPLVVGCGMVRDKLADYLADAAQRWGDEIGATGAVTRTR